MKELPFEIQQLLERFRATGFSAYLVGGAVRDLLRGIEPLDYDVATSALPEEVSDLFSDVLPTGVPHGTVTVREFGISVEVTTFRGDGEYVDHRHPKDVRFVSSIEEDLSRRDFTINAMALAEDGSLVDPFGGRADLAAGNVRAVGDPAVRFAEDALRMYRAVRFASVLDFRIDADTEEAIRKNAELHRAIAVERISAEFLKILDGPNPSASGALVSWGLFDRFLDDRPDEFDARSLDNLRCGDGLRLAAFFALLHVRGALVSISDGARSLKLPAKTQDILKRAAYGLGAPPRSRVGWKSFAARNGDAVVLPLAAMLFAIGKDADAVARAEEMLASDECRRVADLAVNGADMMALGYHGKEVGRVLSALLSHVIRNPEENERGALLALAETFRREE